MTESTPRPPARGLPALPFRASSAWRTSRDRSERERYFVGLYLDAVVGQIQASCVRVWGSGYTMFPDVVATARLNDSRLTQAVLPPSEASAVWSLGDISLSDLAARALQGLFAAHQHDISAVRTVSLLHFGHWQPGPCAQWRFLPSCDTTALAASCGLTVVDNFAGTDIAYRGRGGPCDAVGAWLMLADRGILPGRTIRAVLDLGETARLLLLPPRCQTELPPQLAAYQIVPGIALLRALTEQLTGGACRYDPRESWSVQGRRITPLIEAWRDQLFAVQKSVPHGDAWTPTGLDPKPSLETVRAWPSALSTQTCDVVCSAIHWIADEVANCVRHRLPRSLPVGELILAGKARHHAFLQRELRRRLPEVELRMIDDFGYPGDTWQSVAAALLAALCVDQMPANSPGLTGSVSSQVLGRITPGKPCNWHQVLAELSATLPEKKSLRNAV